MRKVPELSLLNPPILMATGQDPDAEDDDKKEDGEYEDDEDLDDEVGGIFSGGLL